MTVHLVHRNARSVSWAGEEALALIGEQDSTDHEIGPRTSKSSSSLEKPDSKILRGYWGSKGFNDPSPFHIKPLAHAEEEEMSEDEQRKSRLPGYTAENNPVLGRLRSWKGKAPCYQGQSPRASQRKAQVQWASHKGIVDKQFQERLSPPH